jgi:tRNA(fMet)-specific endonuclease VapC
MYALDTNTLIYFFRGDGGIRDRLLAVPPSEIAIPAVVLYEVERGISQSNRPSRRRKELDALLQVIAVLPLDAAGALKSAELSGALHRAGQPIGPMDTLIAGTALAHGATLVTHNTAEFRRVRGLKLEDWFRPQ